MTVERNEEKDPLRQNEKSLIGNYDIICGRDVAAFNNIGNRRFRITIGLYVHRYVSATTRREKKVVLQSVFDIITKDAGARFLKRRREQGSNATFFVVDEREARNKIQHALRDMAALHQLGDNISLL